MQAGKSPHRHVTETPRPYEGGVWEGEVRKVAGEYGLTMGWQQSIRQGKARVTATSHPSLYSQRSPKESAKGSVSKDAYQLSCIMNGP